MEAWFHRETVEQYILRQRTQPDVVERPALESVMPSLSGTHVVDLGAGSGDWAHRVLQWGADRVTAVEPSPVMQQFSVPHPRIHWLAALMEQVSFDPGSVDCVVSIRAFHYVESSDLVFAHIYQWLRSGGSLVFSVEHPLKSANRSGTWIRNDTGQPSAWPIDAYLDQGPRPEKREGVTLTRWHRPVSFYVQKLIDIGFGVRAVLEPDVTDEGRHQRPEVAEELRRLPAVLIVRADKP